MCLPRGHVPGDDDHRRRACRGYRAPRRTSAVAVVPFGCEICFCVNVPCVSVNVCVCASGWNHAESAPPRADDGAVHVFVRSRRDHERRWCCRAGVVEDHAVDRQRLLVFDIQRECVGAASFGTPTTTRVGTASPAVLFNQVVSSATLTPGFLAWTPFFESLVAGDSLRPLLILRRGGKRHCQWRFKLWFVDAQRHHVCLGTQPMRISRRRSGRSVGRLLLMGHTSPRIRGSPRGREDEVARTQQKSADVSP